MKNLLSLVEYIGKMKQTGRTETSKYPEEKKSNRDSVSSGERKRKSLLVIAVLLGECVGKHNHRG